MCLILSDALCFFFAFSHDLRHKISHLFGCTFLHLACDVGVGAKRESRVEVSEHTRYGFHVYAILECQRRECVPLRYNYDKPEKPRRIKGFEVFSLVFHPFPNRKIEPRSSYFVGGVIVTTKIKYCLGGLSVRPRNQDISSEKKKCPFFVPKIRCRQEEHNA